MNRIELGKSGLLVSQLGLGCIDFGTKTNENRAFELIDTYLQNGGNLLDTANNYAFWNGGDGRDSERTIGKYLKSNLGARNSMVLCTKLGALPTDLNRGFESMQGNGRDTILTEVEKSLEALNTDYIDLLYLHVDDFNTDLEETLSALDEVVKKGFVSNIGCSNFYTWRIEQARRICTENGYKFFCAVQQRHSYLEPVMNADFDVQIVANNELKKYLELYQDMTLVSYAPLLGGMYNNGLIEDTRYQTSENEKKLKKLRENNEDPNAWVLSHITRDFGGSVVLFTTNEVEHLHRNMRDFT